MPVISVVIPVYNVERYLSSCLDSLQQQTFTDFEVICVDDGSSDGSLSVLESYANRFADFTIITQNNQGVAGARNVALARMRGQFVMFMDPDDYLHPMALERLYAEMADETVDVVFGQIERTNLHYDWMKENLHPLPETAVKVCFYNPAIEYFYSKTIVPMVFNKLFRISVLKDLRFQPLKLSEDEIYTLEALLRTRKAVSVQLVRYYWYERKGSASLAPIDEKAVEDYFRSIRLICELFSGNPDLLNHIRRTRIMEILRDLSRETALLPLSQRMAAHRKIKSYLSALIKDGILVFGDLKLKDKYKILRLLCGVA